MASTQVWTFNDLVEHVLDAHSLERTAAMNLRSARRAVIEAYRYLTTCYDWSLYVTKYILPTVASQSSSTITFDYTGGAYERMLTIAAGTWPSWAAFGKIIIDGVHYDVEDRKTSTIITLTAASTPTADVAAGKSYKIYRSQYPLPVNFRNMTRMLDADSDLVIPIVTDAQEHYSTQGVNSTPGTPTQACIRGDNEYFGSLAVVFSPPPNAVLYYDVLYNRSARDLNIEKYNTGTVSTSSTTVTGSSTVFPEDCVGSIIRFSSTASVPTSVIGEAGGTSPVDNRYYAQRTITARASDTSLTIDSALTTNVSAKPYIISDPLDIEYHAMFGALKALAEAEFYRFTDRKQWPQIQAMAEKKLLLAIEADSRAPYTGHGYLHDPLKNTTVTNG